MAQRAKYVYVPCDIHEPVQEMEIELREGKEVEDFLDHLKAHFAGRSVRTKAQSAAKQAALLQQLGEAASSVDSGLLETAMNMQMVESIPLLPNSAENGFVGVNMYCDDEAVLKALPVNLRASDVASCCGKPLSVAGDAFFGRIFDNEDDFKRLDFTLAELSSSAPWAKKAYEQNQRKLKAGETADQVLERIQQQKAAHRSGPSASVRELSPAEIEKEKGNGHVKAGRWPEAIAAYTAAVKLDPTLAAAFNNRALAYLKTGQHAEAASDCDRVLNLEASNVKALLRRAAAREALGSNDAAAADYSTALQAEPKNKEAAAGLQRLLPPPPQPAAEAQP